MALRILFFTDLHLRATRPISRKDDDYLGTILGKIDKVVELSKNSDVVIFGGDLVDRPDVPHSVVQRAMRSFAKFDKPVYSVAGNHDTTGFQGETINSSALGVLFESGVIKRLDSIVINNVSIYGIHAFDKDVWTVPESDGPKVIVAHKMLTNIPFPGGKCISIDDVAGKTNANLILSGDIHYPHNEEVNGVQFINPGSLARLSIADRGRHPQVAEILIEDDGLISCNFHVLESRPAECLFDLSAYSNRMASEAHRSGVADVMISAVFSVKGNANNVGELLATALENGKQEQNIRDYVNEKYRQAEKDILQEMKD